MYRREKAKRNMQIMSNMTDRSTEIKHKCTVCMINYRSSQISLPLAESNTAPVSRFILQTQSQSIQIYIALYADYAPILVQNEQNSLMDESHETQTPLQVFSAPQQWCSEDFWCPESIFDTFWRFLATGTQGGCPCPFATPLLPQTP